MKVNFTVQKILNYSFRTISILILIGFVIYSTINRNESGLYKIYHDRLTLKYYSAKDDIVVEIEKYIDSIAPNSGVDGIVLFDECEKWEVDIKFVIAQAHLESHFGTVGMARKTNSVFNVMAYDKYSTEVVIKNGDSYSHPNKSISPYLKLLKKNYLVDKTEIDLLDNFVNTNGDRYASNPNYEKYLYTIYTKIDSIADITNKYNIYKKYKMLINR